MWTSTRAKKERQVQKHPVPRPTFPVVQFTPGQSPTLYVPAALKGLSHALVVKLSIETAPGSNLITLSQFTYVVQGDVTKT